ncbi:MAG: ORF6N domain-containing protein [Nitrospirales bacterium]|nr:ORF6N domain-containing protein [Nitrospirales bacterium]
MGSRRSGTEQEHLIPAERIERRILLLRRQKVMLDADLAELYGVPTKALNQAVKRNKDRFPPDFMFRLSKEEKAEVVTICDHLSNLRFSPMLPHAFTEHGILMLSSVLHSKRAVQVNIAIMRAFVKLREMLSAHTEFRQKLAELERKLESHDGHIRSLFDAIRQLMTPPDPKPRRIGFHAR